LQIFPKENDFQIDFQVHNSAHSTSGICGSILPPDPRVSNKIPGNQQAINLRPMEGQIRFQRRKTCHQQSREHLSGHSRRQGHAQRHRLDLRQQNERQKTQGNHFFLPRKFFPKIETFFLIKKLGRSCDFWLAQAELLAIQAY
jgi:hypothetical protein